MSKQKRIVRLAEIANADPKPTKPRPHTVPLIDPLPSDVETDYEPPTPTVLLSASPSSAPSFLHRPFFQPPTSETNTSVTSGTSVPSNSTSLPSLAAVSFPSLAPSAAWPAAVVAPIAVSTSSPKLFSSSVPSNSTTSTSSNTASATATIPSSSTIVPTLSQSESFSNSSSSASTTTLSSAPNGTATLSGDLSRFVSAITSVKISDKFSSLMPPQKEDQEVRAHLTARVSQFYALHCPDQQANASKVAENHLNDVKLLNKKLRAKYGVDLSSLDEPSAATPPSFAASSSSSAAASSTSSATSAANSLAGASDVVVHTPDSSTEASHLRVSDRGEKHADPVDAISERLLAAETELTEAKEQLETKICAVDRLKVQLDEERDLRRRLEQQVEAIKSLFEQEATRSQQQAIDIQDLHASNEKLRAFQKELEQECQVSLKAAAEGTVKSTRELSEVQAQRDLLASQLHILKSCPIPCDASLVVAVEQHKRLAQREIAHLNEEIVLFRETERARQENYHNADAENSRAELANMQGKLAAAYQILEADQETQYAMEQEVLNIQVKMDKMKGEERERVLDTILALSQMKESIDEQVRVKNAEVQSLREQVGELESACRQIVRDEEEEKARREKGLQTLQRTLNARTQELAQWDKLIANGIIINTESDSYVMSTLLHILQSSSTFLACLQDRRELDSDQEEKAHQQEENRTKQIQSELGELREMLFDAQTGKQRLAAQSSDTIDELRELVAGMQQELAANQQKKKKLLVLPKPQNFYLSRKL